MSEGGERPMARQYVHLRKEEDIGIITIDRPPVNALSVQTVEELYDAFREAAEDKEIKAIVLTGGGDRAFVAGADITEFPKLTPEVGEQMAAKGQAVLTFIEKLPKVVVAAINGFCLGGGNELAMACDVRVASDGARFGQPEMNLGMIPGFGGTQRLPRIVGKSRAKEIIYTGDMITAQEAYRIGLVSKVVPVGDVVRAAKDIARKVALKGAVAIKLAKRAIDEGMEANLAEGLALEAKLFGEICGTEDMREGVAAFLEKRQPKFRGK